MTSPDFREKASTLAVRWVQKLCKGPVVFTHHIENMESDVESFGRDCYRAGLMRAAEIADAECPECQGAMLVRFTRAAHDRRCDGSCSVGCPVAVEDNEPCSCDIHRVGIAIRAEAEAGEEK
jgi:hypothetical protein